MRTRIYLLLDPGQDAAETKLESCRNSSSSIYRQSSHRANKTLSKSLKDPRPGSDRRHPDLIVTANGRADLYTHPLERSLVWRPAQENNFFLKDFMKIVNKE